MRLLTRFQSTRPRGARRCHAASPTCPACFNPRAREGRDSRENGKSLPILVSIHAPARGATWQADAWYHFVMVSIHAPARGATANQRGFRGRFLFQSTRPRGARRRGQPRHNNIRSFNPRAREGRDGIDQTTLTQNRCFNPRAREGRDPLNLRRGLALTSFNPRAREGRDNTLPASSALTS